MHSRPIRSRSPPSAPTKKDIYIPSAGGDPRLITGLNQGEQPITWSGDGQSLYIYQPGELPARVYRLDVKSGTRTLWKELMPSDPAGVENIGPIYMTPDAKTCVFGYHRMLADLIFGRRPEIIHALSSVYG